MSTQLELNIDAILNQKNDYIVPENIRAGVTVLGVTGTYGGGGSEGCNAVFSGSYETLPYAGNLPIGTLGVVGSYDYSTNEVAISNIYVVENNEWENYWQQTTNGYNVLYGDSYNNALNNTNLILGDSPQPEWETKAVGPTATEYDGISISAVLEYNRSTSELRIIPSIYNNGAESTYITASVIRLGYYNGNESGNIYIVGPDATLDRYGTYIDVNNVADLNTTYINEYMPYIDDISSISFASVIAEVPREFKFFFTEDGSTAINVPFGFGVYDIDDPYTSAIRTTFDAFTNIYTTNYKSSASQVKVYGPGGDGYAMVDKIITYDELNPSEPTPVEVVRVSGEYHTLTMKFHGDDQEEGQYMQVGSVICYGPDSMPISFMQEGDEYIANVPYGLCNYMIYATGYGSKTGRFTMPDEDHEEVITLEKETVIDLNSVGTSYPDVSVSCRLIHTNSGNYIEPMVQNSSASDITVTNLTMNFTLGADTPSTYYNVVGDSGHTSVLYVNSYGNAGPGRMTVDDNVLDYTAIRDVNITLDSQPSGQPHLLTIVFSDGDTGNNIVMNSVAAMDKTTWNSYTAEYVTDSYQVSIPAGEYVINAYANGYANVYYDITMPDEDYYTSITVYEEKFKKLDDTPTEYEDVYIGCELRQSNGTLYVSPSIINNTDYTLHVSEARIYISGYGYFIVYPEGEGVDINPNVSYGTGGFSIDTSTLTIDDVNSIGTDITITNYPVTSADFNAGAFADGKLSVISHITEEGSRYLNTVEITNGDPSTAYYITSLCLNIVTDNGNITDWVTVPYNQTPPAADNGGIGVDAYTQGSNVKFTSSHYISGLDSISSIQYIEISGTPTYSNASVLPFYFTNNGSTINDADYKSLKVWLSDDTYNIREHTAYTYDNTRYFVVAKSGQTSFKLTASNGTRYTFVDKVTVNCDMDAGLVPVTPVSGTEHELILRFKTPDDSGYVDPRDLDDVWLVTEDDVRIDLAGTEVYPSGFPEYHINLRYGKYIPKISSSIYMLYSDGFIMDDDNMTKEIRVERMM